MPASGTGRYRRVTGPVNWVTKRSVQAFQDGFPKESTRSVLNLIVRGALGVTVPTNETHARSAYLDFAPFSGFNAAPASFTSFDARLAVGHHIRAADARLFPNFVYYVAANLHSQLHDGHANDFSLTPGQQFGIGNDWYFLGGLEVPLVGPLPFQTQTIFQLIKNF